MAPTSFMSEHSIEYSLVHHLVGILSPLNKQIIPIYLWMTREGNNMALASLPNMPFKLVAVYARRPKIEYANVGPLDVKFNFQVLGAAKQYQRRGIPVLAGMPLIAGLGSYSLDVPCVWFELLGINDFDGDFHLTVTLDGELLEPLPVQSPVRGPINVKEIPELVSSRSQPASWPELVSYIREVRAASKSSYSQGFLWFGGGYKPFYLLIGG